MGNDDRRFKRFVVLSYLVFLFIVVCIIFLGSLQFSNLHGQLAAALNKKPEVVKGINGVDGSNGLSGLNGLSIEGSSGIPGTDGQNGQSATPAQIASAVSQYLQINPPASGPQGQTGDDGKTLEIRLRQDTCELQSKYTESDIWSDLAQLPSPCTPNQDTE